MDPETEYEVAHVKEALATDPRVNAPELTVRIGAGIVHVDGVVPTEQRREGVKAVVAELCPGFDIDDRTTVSTYPPEKDAETLS